MTFSKRFLVFSLLLLLSCFSGLEASEFKAMVSQAKDARNRGDIEQALNGFLQVLHSEEPEDYDDWYSYGLLQGGNTFFSMGSYLEAFDFFSKGLVYSDLHDNKEDFSLFTMSIGNIFAVYNDYDRALDYYKQTFELAKKEDFQISFRDVLTNLVIVSALKGDVQQAKQYLELEKAAQAENPYLAEHRLAYNQGIIYSVENKYTEAIESFRQSMRAVAGVDSLRDVADIYNEMSKMYLGLEQRDSALYCLHQAIDLAKATGIRNQQHDVYKNLSNYYNLMGQYDSAFYYQTLYLNLSDSIYNQQLFSSSKAKLFRFEKNQDEQKISFLTTQVKRLIAMMAIVLAFLLLIFYFNRRMRHAQKLLVMRNEELMQQNNAYLKMVKSMSVVQPADANEPSVSMPTASADSSSEEEADSNRLSAINLSPEKAGALLRDILEVMNDVDVISRQDFTMNMLAKMINSNTSYISAVINDTYQKNFKSFLNEYRIREACRRLTDTEHYGNLTITAISEAVGYSSRTNFVLAFKKVMGMTPSAYQKLSKQEPD